MEEQDQKTRQPDGSVGGMTGGKSEPVKGVERARDGEVVAEPGDVRYVRDETQGETKADK